MSHHTSVAAIRTAEATGTAPLPAWCESAQAGDAASLADILIPVRSVLPDALIDDRGWDRLLARAGRLPPSAADAMFGFECRLGQEEAQADLLLSVPPNSPFARWLARGGGAGRTKPAGLARFLHEMRRQGSPLAAAVDLVALEYDMAGVENDSAPGVFIRSVAESGHEDAGVLTGAIALAAGWSETLTERSGVARILTALPRGAAIRWAGGFPDRSRRAVRLLIRGLGEGSAGFLSRIGWGGDASAVDRVISVFRSCGVDNHVLALDIAEGRVSPGIGLELSRPEPAGGDWNKALDMMVHERWCQPQRAAALGRVTLSERIFSRDGVSELHCGIHHLKIALPISGSGAADRALAAKAYIACVLRRLP